MFWLRVVKPRSSRYILCWLFFFAALGATLAIVCLKRYAASALTELLAHEVEQSCNCTFAVDDVRISLLTLTARASNARILSEGEDKVRFKELQAVFGLPNFTNNTIPLEDLELTRGSSLGVGPDSAIFKFVSYLAEPLPPEKDTPGRWKIKLQRLHLKHSRFEEVLGAGKLRGRNVSLFMRRNKDNDFDLHPRIRSLGFQPFSEGPEKFGSVISLGAVSGLLTIRDDHVDFKRVSLFSPGVTLQSQGKVHTNQENRLEGNSLFDMDTGATLLGEWIQAKTHGQISLSHTLEEPDLDGTFTLVPGEIGRISTPLGQLPALEQFAGTFTSSLQERKPLATLHVLDAKGEGFSASVLDPLELKEGLLSGQLLLHLAAFDRGDYHLKDLKLWLAPCGSLSKFCINVKGRSGSGDFGGISLDHIDFDLETNAETLTLKATADSAVAGSLAAQADLTFSDGELRNINELDFKLIDFAIPAASSTLKNLSLTGAGSLRGGPKLDQLQGEAQISLVPREIPTLPLQVGLKLKAGVISADFSDKDRCFFGNSEIDLNATKGSTLAFTVTNFDLARLSPKLACSHTTLKAEYTFDLGEPLAGNGAVLLSDLQIGCAPYQIKSAAPQSLKIDSGRISLDRLKLVGLDTEIKIAGGASSSSGYDIQLDGVLQMNALASAIPTLDDLQGQIEASLSIKGPLSDPQFNGQGRLLDAKLDSAAADISAEGILGSFRMEGTDLVLDQFYGVLNGGTVELKGRLSPFDLKASTLTLSLADVLLEPNLDSSLVVSAELDLSQSEEALPRLSGEVKIKSAELRKAFDIKMILRELTEYVFKRQRIEQSLTDLPEVQLDIKLTAGRNILLITNFIEAELKANLSVHGTLAAPLISGSLETLSGWIGINERRFDLTSGKIIFRPEDRIPSLEAVGQALWFSRSGDTIFVMLEADGLLTAPRISLSSDGGLSQAELATLFAAGETSTRQTLINSPSRLDNRGKLSILSASDHYTFTHFINELTSVDSLSVESRDNLRTGLIEPVVIAKKKLGKDLMVVGESFLGSEASDPKLAAVYNLTPRLTLSGTADTLTTQRNTSLGADLTYTLLSRVKTGTRVTILGNEALRADEILDASQLTQGSIVNHTELYRIRKDVQKFYRSNGYFETSVELHAAEEEDPLRALEIRLYEGPLSRIQGVIYEGDPLPLDLAEELASEWHGSKATADVLESVQSLVIRTLRERGFIAARISAKYLPVAGQADKVLQLKVITGMPVKFNFKGNRVFSDKELLASISLMKRRQPFGRNTIRILSDSIRKKYRESGYYYVDVKYASENIAAVDPASSEIRYQIEINEGPRVRVSSVKLSGNQALSEQDLLIRARRQHAAIYEEIFEPRYAVASNLESGAAVLQSIYEEEGYQRAKVRFKVEPQADDELLVEYLIEEGALRQVTEIETVGFPVNLPSPTPPKPPYSIVKTNRYLEELTRTLIFHGYLLAAVSSKFDPENGHLLYLIEPGPRTKISSISISGNEEIPTEVIRKNLLVTAGDAWDGELLGRSKRRLLKLGLFSLVELTPADGELNSASEELKVRVLERALQTLEVGFGANSELGYHFFSEGSDKSLFSDGKTLTLGADVYYDYNIKEVSHGIAGLKYLDPLLFDGANSFSSELRYQKLDMATLPFDLDRLVFDSAIYRSRDSGFSRTFGYTLMRQDLSNVATDAVLSSLDQGPLTIGFLSGTVSLDKRSNPVNPNTGYFANFDYRLAAKPLGSSAEYGALGARFSFLQELVGPLLLANNSRGAIGWSFGSTKDIPISERYFLGGRTTVRGYGENSLGPRGEDGSVIGGDLLVQNNTELRYLIAEALSLNAFIDGGNTYLKDDGVDLSELRWGAGIGIRYLSPVGPIGIDIGHPLARRRDEKAIRVHFSIGSIF
ncbi:MAG: BamA/TamA family outer membrane protein [Deltaproteobacteria bacterium]|nr:BamA/TamA family outer membrane protein [Deltaproteobacteria bacterium]